MRDARWVRAVGAALLLAGCTAWVLVVLAEPGVRAVAPSLVSDGRNASGDVGMDELELLVVDLRLAPLLLILCGVIVLTAPAVRSARQAGAAIGGSALVLLAASGLLALLSPRPVPTVLAGVGLLAIAVASAVVIRDRADRWAPGFPAGSEAGRRLVAWSGIPVVASAPLLESFLPGDAWARAALPVGYQVAVPLLQGLLVLAGLLMLLVAQPRPGAVQLVAGAVVAVVGAWLVLGSPPFGSMASLLAVGGPLVGAATVAASAGDSRSGPTSGSTWREDLLVAAVPAITYPIWFYASLVLGLPLGAFALAVNGGAIGVDGLPVFLVGTVSGLLGVAACYLRVAPRKAVVPAATALPTPLQTTGVAPTR